MIHCMKTLFIGVLFLIFSNAEAQDIDIVTYELVGNNLGEQENHSVDEEFRWTTRVRKRMCPIFFCYKKIV